MRREKIKESADYATVKCAFCKGRGVDPFSVLSHLSNCPTCHGRGEVRVKEPYTTCPACGGTGIYTRSRLYCWTCRGKGVVHACPPLTSLVREGT
jgi:DnaJ-class molecular chaperone